MNNEADLLDERAIATKLATRALNKIVDSADDAARRFWSRQRNKDIGFFANYIVGMRTYCRSIKNFVSAGKNSDLQATYVAQHVRNFEDKFSSAEFLALMMASRSGDFERPVAANVLEAPAGAGKTIFLKHAFLSLSESNSDKIPLFIELRNLRTHSGKSIEDLIFDYTRIFEKRLMREQIMEGLRSGLYFLLFDGFDEVSLSDRKFFETEMARLSTQYVSTPILVSGRPHNSFTSWPLFGTYNIVPLTLEQATELLEKLDYDEETTSAFLVLLSEKLFRSHYDFASVPLLLTIMLITFAHVGTISSKRHEFFEDAFDALWNKHDLKSKAGWVRERETRLSKSKFLELLSAFCFSAYLDEDYDFDTRNLSQHLRQAGILSGHAVKSEEFLADVQVSLCLMLQDGRKYRFIHRTFQEYYAALFITSLDDEALAETLNAIKDRAFVDNVLDLTFSIDRKRVEANFVLPIVSKYESVLGKKIVPSDEYLNMYREDDIDILRLLYNFRYTLPELDEAIEILRSIAHDLRVDFGGSIDRTFIDLMNEKNVGDPIFEDRKKIALIVNRVTEDCARNRIGIREFLRKRQPQ